MRRDGILVFIIHIKPTMCSDDTHIKNLISCSVNNKRRDGILVFIIHIKSTICTDDTNIKNLISCSVNNKGLEVFNDDIGIILTINAEMEMNIVRLVKCVERALKNVYLRDANGQFCFRRDGILVFIMHIKPTICTDDTNIKNLFSCSVNNKGLVVFN
ncbi:hypothetical protein C0J52_25063 [Blattella germanica]|nr:hypothetical protein C0J52_25063 [Blattella germanica]